MSCSDRSSLENYSQNKTKKIRKGRKRNPISNFLLITYKMLEVTNKQNPKAKNTIEWAPDGNSILIKNIEEFTKVLPIFFKTKNYSSFVRQLNMYGFHKQKNSDGVHEFKHEYFKKGDISSLAKIQRKLNEQPENKGESYLELKNLQYEYQRLKKVNSEFEDSLKVLIKQNKKLMEANRQLVYQFYYFKKESDLKSKKLMFLIYCLLNARSDIKDSLSKNLMEIINPSFKFNQIKKPFDLKQMIDELESKTETELASNPLLLKEMMNTLFTTSEGNNNTPIDNLIEQHAHSGFEKNFNNSKNHNKDEIFSAVDNYSRYKNSRQDLNEDLDMRIPFDIKSSQNDLFKMPSQQIINPSGVNSIYRYNDGIEKRSFMGSIDKSRGTEGGSLLGNENQALVMDSIENNMINYRFNPSDHNNL